MALITAPPVDSLLQALAARTGDDALVHLERLPARPARYASPARAVAADLRERLAVHGIDDLWTHQAAAIDLIRDRQSVVIATGTASGKSLCYQLPIAEAVADRVQPGTALVLFPTKALAQDQLRAFAALDPPGLIAATYDGDTPPDRRTWVRREANVVLTNPEMLHAGLLPHHGRWATFLMRLRYVVVDELHMLRGVFGTHVAHLLRRLRRLCAQYGASPTFVFSSATIGQPERLASALCGLPVTAIDDDGSPHGERYVALWNPPMVDAGSGARVSPNAVTADLLAELVLSGHRTLAFCRSRRGTEVVAADVVRRHPTLAGAVRPYRGGYLAAERREVEAELFGGRLRGVVATSALELGVDVGGLDACVLNGFPGTIASMWQQVGRAGREGQPSLAVLVAGDDQLDQYLMAHPDEVFSRSPEPAVVNRSNPFVLDPHLACAAFEHPLGHHDAMYWGDDLDDGVRRLVLDDRLRLRHGRWGRGDDVRGVWAGRGYPSRGIGLRSGSAEEVRIARADGTIIGTVDRGRACSTVHPGAIYLHQGQPWRVVRLDLGDPAAIVEVADGGEYTQARADTSIRILATDARRPVGRVELFLGTVEVTSRVTGYQRRDAFTGEVLGSAELDLPPSELVTRGFWWVMPPDVLAHAGITAAAVPGTLHAVEHAAIAMLPLFTICDRWDVGGVSTAWLADTAAPTIVVHDAYPGGAGVAELGFEAADRHLVATLEVLEACPCTDGCPSCVQSPKCGNLNEPLDKAGAIRLLRVVLDA
ncbi:MAG: helicase/secretion neighborhood putative DEAH-box helicase [Acidimicrobiales bacterium]|nr:helicase/secretion neighborhood putative DEAH-box helicase [Acidimicrobiales bacterium]